ncbi:MAG: hypothetical protein ABIG44_02535 [Planctomycetota bacterium]
MKKLIGCTCVLLFAYTTLGQEVKPVDPPVSSGRPEAPAVRDVLATRLAEVSFQEVPLERIIDWLAEQTGMNIHVRWQILADSGIERDRPISIKVRNLRLSQMLWMILREAAGVGSRLGYQAAGKLLIISTHDDLNSEMIVRTYDVRDLLAQVPRFRNAPRVDPAQVLQAAGNNSGGLMASSTDEPDDADLPTPATLVELITTTIEPDSWASNGGKGTIMAWQGTIVVRNSRYVHELLAGPTGNDMER